MIVSLSICLLLAVSSAFSHGISKYGLNSSCYSDTDCHQIEHSHCYLESCQCIPGYTIDGSLTECLKVANGYYDTCEESVQCSSFLGAGGTCNDNGECVCKENYHYLHGRCYETKGLNDVCDNDDECFVNADHQAAICKDNKCQCSEEYYQREYSTCRPKVKVNETCVLDSDCLFYENASCVSEICTLNTKETRIFEHQVLNTQVDSSKSSKDLVIGESKCKDDDDCKLLDHTICAVNNTCVCDVGYYTAVDKNDKVNFCAPELGTDCDGNSESKLDFRVCKNNRWTCTANRTTTKDNQDCRKFTSNIGGKCDPIKYPEMCYLFGPRVQCLDDKCVCNEGSHWVAEEKFCWKSSKIGEACNNNYDCYSRGDEYKPTCDENVCTCPENSIVSDDGGYCLSNEPVLGSYCEKNEECETIPNSTCEDNKCSCVETFFELDEECVPGLNAICENDDDCKLENTACYPVDENNICQCAENFIVGPDNDCIKKAYFNQLCEHDVQCSAAVKNTFCNMTTIEEAEYDDDETGFCDCIDKDYYFNMDGCYIKKFLGEECTMGPECYTLSMASDCRRGICSCKFDFIQVDRDCKPKNTSPGLFYSCWLLLAMILVTIP